jgi:hypothetical protein
VTSSHDICFKEKKSHAPPVTPPCRLGFNWQNPEDHSLLLIWLMAVSLGAALVAIPGLHHQHHLFLLVHLTLPKAGNNLEKLQALSLQTAFGLVVELEESVLLFSLYSLPHYYWEFFTSDRENQKTTQSWGMMKRMLLVVVVGVLVYNLVLVVVVVVRVLVYNLVLVVVVGVLVYNLLLLLNLCSKVLVISINHCVVDSFH